MRGNQKNKDYVFKWSPDVAYAVGLITTDGNLSRDGRHINLTSKDVDLLETFKKCLDLDVAIRYKTGGFTKEKYPWVSFSHKKLYDTLLEIGLTPNKTKTLGELAIPDDLFFDFLRGHLDGDGSFYSYWDKRWPNSFVFYVSFLSSSRSHIDWLRSCISERLKITGGLGRSRSLWKLNYAKKDSLKLLPRLYYTKSVPCLRRKREKVEKIVSLQNGRVPELVDGHG